FGGLSAFLGLSLGVLGIVLFTLMTGASATIVRASIMAIIALIARSSGKTYAVTRALFLAVFIMILENPKILRFDASFQLSLLATLGLIYLSPILEKRFRFLPNTLNLREATVATVGTQIFVLPLLLYTSGVLSLVSLPVNLLTLIVVPLTMFFGFLAGGVGIVSAIVATPFAWISYTLSEYILQVGRIFSKIPFGSLTINYFPFWLMVGIYTLYAWGIVTLRKKQDV
ncbi:MAG TPA: ComEC/Rec2 family competence protein, partial [Candidatus Paceibacterota bacterium]